MYINAEVKANIFAENSPKGSATDTGSAESQIALFTFRINSLNEHLKKNPKDKATQTGLLRLVGKRRRLLNYLRDNSLDSYRQLIKKLNIRR